MATYKQIKAIKNFTENQGNAYRAMLDAGYSENTAAKPGNLTNSKTFREMLDLEVSQQETAKQLGNLLRAAKLDHYVFPMVMEDQEIIEIVESIPGCTLKQIKHGQQAKYAYYWSPDNRSKKDGIDIVMKVRGEYAPQKIQRVDDELNKLTTDQLDAKIRELEAETKALRVIPAPVQGEVKNG